MTKKHIWVPPFSTAPVIKPFSSPVQWREKPKTFNTAAAITVEGAGSPEVNGVYVRSSSLVKARSAEIYQKPGTRLAVLKRGEESDWSLVDLGGKPSDSLDQGEYHPARSSLSWSDSQLGSSLLRWRPQALELYSVGSALSSRQRFVPPEVGWHAVEGLSPAPSMRVCDTAMPPEVMLMGKVPGMLIQQAAESIVDQGVISRRMFKPRMNLRTASAPILPPLHQLEQSLSKMSSRPGVKQSINQQQVDLQGATMLHQFSVLLTRPSFHTPWGLRFSNDVSNETGRRIIHDLERYSPLERWNTWQTVRGRPDLCVRPGDQLIKIDGLWAHNEFAVDKADGFEDFPDPPPGIERPPGVGATRIQLEFGRTVKRPYAPAPPKIDTWDVGYGLRVDLSVYDAGPWKSKVKAWALVFKEEIPPGTLGTGPQGKPTNCWYVYDGESAKVKPFLKGKEVASVKGDLQDELSLYIAIGLKAGRSYWACTAFLTDSGWSAFSELTRPMQIKKRPGLPDGMVAVTQMPQAHDDQVVTSEAFALQMKTWGLDDAPILYVLPEQIKPGWSAPIASQSQREENCALLTRKRLLMMSIVLHGRPTGLKVSITEEGGNTLVVDDPGTMPLREGERQILRLAGLDLQWTLRANDFIIRINGATGGMKMVEELTRNPPVLTMEVMRACGGKKDEAAQCFELVELDEDFNKNVEQMRVNGHYIMADAKMVMTMQGSQPEPVKQAVEEAVRREEDIYRRLYNKPSDYQVTAQDRAEGLPPNMLLEEATRRMLVLQRNGAAEDKGTVSAGAESIRLAEACRSLNLVLAHPSCDPEALSQQIVSFAADAGPMLTTSKFANTLHRRACFQASLWAYRTHVAQMRTGLREAMDEMLRMEKVEASTPEDEYTPQLMGQMIDARNALQVKVAECSKYSSALPVIFDEAEAVNKRSTEGVKVVVTASGEVLVGDSFYPEKSMDLGMKMGWW